MAKTPYTAADFYGNPEVEAKLLARVEKRADGCWVWTAGKFHGGYGQIAIGSACRAHRIAYMVWRGPIPRGLIVRHVCDNPPCINPSHLMIGTNADNIRDRITRGRRGISSHLTDDEIRAIRLDSRLQNAIADEYGICQSTVSRIKARVMNFYVKD